MTLHGISGNKVNARTRHAHTLKQKNYAFNVSYVLVTCLINSAAIVFLRTVETKERVKILLPTLYGITRSPCQMYSSLFEVKVAFDLYKHYVVSCKAFYKLTNTILVVNIQCNIDQ